MNKLAICVPTRGHADVVNEIVNFCAEYIKTNDVDMYYYDSSFDNSTELVINNIRNKGYSNIYYVKVNEKCNFGDKLDLIFSGYKQVCEYDYIWPIKDRAICNEEMLRTVLRICDKKIDGIVPVSLPNIFQGNYCIFDSVVDVYRLFAAPMTSVESIIFNRKRIFDDYYLGKTANVSKHQKDFWHFYYFFKKSAEIKDVSIAVINKEGAYIVNSSLPVKSFWFDDFFETWIEEWIKVNYELPEMYDSYKLRVIKDCVSIRELLGEEKTFIRLREMGILNKEVYYKYANLWKYVTYIPEEKIKSIACL